MGTWGIFPLNNLQSLKKAPLSGEKSLTEALAKSFSACYCIIFFEIHKVPHVLGVVPRF